MIRLSEECRGHTGEGGPGPSGLFWFLLPDQDEERGLGAGTIHVCFPRPLNTARGWGRLSGKPSRLRVHRRHGWPRSALYALHVYRSLHLRLSTVTVRSLRATAIKTKQGRKILFTPKTNQSQSRQVNCQHLAASLKKAACYQPCEPSKLVSLLTSENG